MGQWADEPAGFPSHAAAGTCPVWQASSLRPRVLEELRVEPAGGLASRGGGVPNGMAWHTLFLTGFAGLGGFGGEASGGQAGVDSSLPEPPSWGDVGKLGFV